ncbi:hypothetical protein C6P41_004578 [Kluyveromyces marxianus]|nr:hypothetical protein C6P41_000270 [Kluyveromyces marxianus]KAG0681195.1 hypothetical protein C6P41_004578 [Kluyveromyces marxianus]
MNTFGSTFYEGIAQNFSCECESCKISKNVQFYMTRFFLMGFVLPLLWIVNIGLYIYCNWIVDNTEIAPEIDVDTLFTDFELNDWKKRSTTSLSTSQKWKSHTVAGESMLSLPTLFSTEFADEKEEQGQGASSSQNYITQQCVSEIAKTIVDIHSRNSQAVRSWFLRSLGALLGYVAIIITLVLIFVL